MERDTVTVITKDKLFGRKLPRLRFAVKAVTHRTVSEYQGAPGQRARSDVSVLDVQLAPVAGSGHDVELRGLSPEAAKPFKVGGKLIIEFVPV